MACLAVPAFAFADFNDLYQSSSYYDAVTYLADNGIVQGYEDGSFRPYNNINRAEFLKILVASNYSSEDIASCISTDFSDVPISEWYTGFICIGQREGIVGGYPDGSFRPGNPINFVEAAKIIVKTYDSSVQQKEGTDWFLPYLEYLEARNNIPWAIYGMSMDISRGIMAEMIYRMENNITNKDSWTIADLYEIMDGGIIYSYYMGIPFEEAYNLKYNPPMTFQEFQDLYEGSGSFYPVQVNKLSDNSYEAIVFERFFDGDFKGVLYRAVLEIVDHAKFKTLSTEQLDSYLLEEVDYSASLKAYTKWENNRFNLYLVKNGEEEVIDTLSDSYVFPVDLSFSSTGKYLTVCYVHIEGCGRKIFDTEEPSRNTNLNTGMISGYTDNDEYYYACMMEDAIGWSGVYVLRLSDFMTIFDESFGAKDCLGFDEATNTIYWQDNDDVEQSFTIP